MNVLCAVFIHILVLWPVPSWILVYVYLLFINIFCLNLQRTVKMR